LVEIINLQQNFSDAPRAILPEVSVVVGSYQIPDLMLELLQALALKAPVGVEIIIIDMGNPRPQRTALNALAQLPGIKLLVATTGLVGAYNLGARHARGQYLWLLNEQYPCSLQAMATLLAQRNRFNFPCVLSLPSVGPKGWDLNALLTPRAACWHWGGGRRLAQWLGFSRQTTLGSASGQFHSALPFSGFLVKTEFFRKLSGLSEQYGEQAAWFDFFLRWQIWGGSLYQIASPEIAQVAWPLLGVKMQFQLTRGWVRFYRQYFAQTPARGWCAVVIGLVIIHGIVSSFKGLFKGWGSVRRQRWSRSSPALLKP
jgi:hypothetical protein